MRKQFYLDLVQRLKLIENQQAQQVITHFDIWNNQLHPDWTEQFRFPAVFLAYKPIAWRPLGRNRQEAYIDFDLHVCSTTKARSSDKSPFQDKALAHLDILDAILYQLTGWRGNYFGSITRRGSSQPDYYLDSIRHVETYRMQAVDDNAMKSFINMGEGDRLVLNVSFKQQ